MAYGGRHTAHTLICRYVKLLKTIPRTIAEMKKSEQDWVDRFFRLSWKHDPRTNYGLGGRYSNALTLAAGHSNVCFSLGSRALGSSWWFYTVEFFDDIHLFKWHLEQWKLRRSQRLLVVHRVRWSLASRSVVFEATTSNKNWRWRSRQIRKIFRFHRGKNAATDYCLMRIYINQLNQVESLSMTWILPSLSFRQDAQGLTALAQALKAWKARDQSSEWEPLICSTRIWSHTNLLQVSFLYLF